MAGSGSPLPPKQSRHKQTRPTICSTSNISTGSVRQRSPANNEDPSDIRAPPTKRARKAINCEPCRNSKLKCDRARPCSSCVLRGTASQCYQGADGPAFNREDVAVDPSAEFARLRYSLSLLENHYLHGTTTHQESLAARYTSEPIASSSKTEEAEMNMSIDEAPGMHGRQGESGFYTGPTSTASHLIMNGDRSRTPSEERQKSDVSFNHDYDRDLIELLPPLYIIDALVDYYFEYCNWVYRHINQSTFIPAWQKFKSGGSPDRIILATAATIVALTVRYLPPGHELLASLSGPFTHDSYYNDLSAQYYEVMKKALKRYQDETKVYNLDLVELQLLRAHYLTFAKTDPEEIWSVRGELVTMGTAMGLHRDPGKNRFSRDTAERRRWAWWHIILLERWQSFMFGRPLAIASHHFNTQLPSYCDPELDRSGRLYLPNIALFRLAFITGEIMEDAVSLRPVSYESFQAKDRLLTQWMDSLPAELDLDEFRVARSLCSPITSVRRLGVQSVVLRTAYHHIRFTLHRPFAGVHESTKMSQSLELAVASADKLLSLAAQTTPEYLTTNTGVKTHPPIDGHMNWRSFHVFSAAMFFSFQLIQNPDQLAASLFRSYIRKSIGFLEQSRNIPVTEKALIVLLTLAPLYSEEFLALDMKSRELEKAAILSSVKTLAFPYQDPPARTKSDSPHAFAFGSFSSGGSNHESPARSSVSPADDTIRLSALACTDQYGTGSSSFSTMPSFSIPQASSSMQGYTPSPPIVQSTQQQQLPMSNPQPMQSFPMPRSPNLYVQQQQYQQQQYLFGDTVGPARTSLHVPAADDWGGSVGFAPSEWMRFMDVMERPLESQMGPPGAM